MGLGKSPIISGAVESHYHRSVRKNARLEYKYLLSRLKEEDPQKAAPFKGTSGLSQRQICNLIEDVRNICQKDADGEAASSRWPGVARPSICLISRADLMIRIHGVHLSIWPAGDAGSADGQLPFMVQLTIDQESC
uniref:Uncharacterized protein n=1 Tax=Bionectria ochroleuca TaxID=29856 RepID=A0A8H7KAS0_BIOOC